MFIIEDVHIIIIVPIQDVRISCFGGIREREKTLTIVVYEHSPLLSLENLHVNVSWEVNRPIKNMGSNISLALSSPKLKAMVEMIFWVACETNWMRMNATHINVKG